MARFAVGAAGSSVASVAYAQQTSTPAATPPIADMVRAKAAALSLQPYQPPVQQQGAPAAFTYDDWRRVRFRRDRTLWDQTGSLIHLQYFPTGYIYRDPVELFQVVDGQISPILPNAADFDVPSELGEAMTKVLGMSGFRMQSQINRPGVFDEIAVFQGASYFRSLGRDQAYGLSARAIALGTGDQGEEFPAFRAFWLERPAAGSETVVIHALMDGPSLAGAYRFSITPRDTTVFEIEASLYPRKEIVNGGLGPQSSMFLFGPADRSGGADDFRGAVHDSDGLEIWTGDGRRLWRPLTNPRTARISRFEDVSPRGFGLIQRARNFAAFNDLEARYDRRPSLWVEPVGTWGPGAVHLLEMPTTSEVNDNIAAFWRPAEPWRAGQEVRIAYRLYWGEGGVDVNAPAKVVQTHTGVARVGDVVMSNKRQFVVDFAGVAENAPGLKALVSASAGKVGPAALNFYREGDLTRAAFHFTPPSTGSADLELRLVGDSGDLSETWRFLWTR